MERLEAALAKAREQRRSSGPPAGGGPRLGRSATAVADWMSLREFTISRETGLRHRLTALSGGRDATAYDMLRSRVLRQMKEKSWTRLAVTSPSAGSGKTTISANLALSLARQPELRVMLLDLDMRRPALHQVFEHSGRESFSSVLEGKIGFAEQGERFGENLAVGFTFTPVRHPSELLQSTQAKDVLDEIEKVWAPDIIICDMPPMLATDENVGFLSNVDCALLAAAAESTSVHQIDVCEKELAELTNVLGVVLNKCRYTDTTTGYDNSYY